MSIITRYIAPVAQKGKMIGTAKVTDIRCEFWSTHTTAFTRPKLSRVELELEDSEATWAKS